MDFQLLFEFGIALTRNSELHSLRLKKCQNMRIFYWDFGIALTPKSKNLEKHEQLLNFVDKVENYKNLKKSIRNCTHQKTGCISDLHSLHFRNCTHHEFGFELTKKAVQIPFNKAMTRFIKSIFKSN